LATGAAQNSADHPVVLFSIFQNEGRTADGGVRSITEIVTRLRRCRPILLTQLETPFNSRWLQSSLDLRVRPASLAFWRGGPKSLSTTLSRVADCAGMNLFVYRLLRHERAAVLHCNDPAAFWHSCVAAKAARSALVFNVRGTLGDPASISVARRLKWQRMFALADRVILLSEEMRTFYRNELRLRGEHEEKLAVISGIVDPEVFYPASPQERKRLRAQVGIAAEECAIGYIAAFEPLKGQLEFLHGWARGCRNSALRSGFIFSEISTRIVILTPPLA
jgi:glycosyltransferase involved in cell wall biosynthesis